MANKAHIEKTLEYVEELKKVLPKDFIFRPLEMRYVDSEGRVMQALEESDVHK